MALLATSGCHPNESSACAGLALDGAAREAYARTAERLLEPYREAELRRRVAEEVLPRLLSNSS